LENAGQHFDGGGFARPIWPDITDQFARSDLKGDILDGPDLFIVGREKGTQPAQEARLAFQDPEDFA
jgi:hypothetical protein